MTDIASSNMIAVLVTVVWAIIAVGFLQVLLQLVQLVIALVAIRNSDRNQDNTYLRAQSSGVAPPITLLVPAFNEAMTIASSLDALLRLDYPRYEIIAINDGSTDGTLDVLAQEFDLERTDSVVQKNIPHERIKAVYRSKLFPKLLVIDKENGGKADSLNAGINLSRTPLFCTVDADSILEADTLLRSVQPFLDNPDETIAVGGTVRIANGCSFEDGRLVEVGLSRQGLPLVQTLEYLRAFLVARLAWSRLNALTLVSGAFGVFRTSVASAAGGYDRNTVGEDFELVLRMHRFQIDMDIPHRVVFVPEPVCWTEAPSSLAVLARQRIRWQRGALETFFKHADVVWKPKYGRIGAVTFLNTFLVDVLNPVMEVIGYVLVPVLWIIGILSVDYALAFLALTVGYGIFFSLSSLILAETELKRYTKVSDILLLGLAAVLENFGYRQINNIWRLVGWWQFLKKSKAWGVMPRQGFAKSRKKETSNGPLE